MSEHEGIRAQRERPARPADAGGGPSPGSPAFQVLWRGLELPPPPAAPPGFAARVAARARADRGASLGLPLAPLWARSLAALALVAGIASGVGLGLALVGSERDPDLAWTSSTLADEYYDGALAGSADSALEEGTR